jgi:NAD(P)-dependent dehydrogenase (short-subunit alcohol dehydrogenase family)
MVTGGNTGIGRATEAGLARRGGRVYVACRSQEKGRRAVADIVAATGNDAVAFLPLDLADLVSVRRCAGEFLALGEPLHVLINNAGVAGQRGVTRDGFELAFGVNHLGHFALTTALLDRLAASAPARVVTVASDSHYQASGVDFGAVRRPTARTWPAPCGSTARPGSRPDPRTDGRRPFWPSADTANVAIWRRWRARPPLRACFLPRTSRQSIALCQSLLSLGGRG